MADKSGEIDNKDQQLLVRATVNYLFLAQFETFRASLLSLQKRNPALALAILQAIVERGGRLEGVTWSSRTSSPAQLTWLSLAELLGLGSSSAASGDPIWNLHPEAFKLKSLKTDIFQHSFDAEGSNESFIEAEIKCLRIISGDHPYLIDALCDNIQRQSFFNESNLEINIYDSSVGSKSLREDDRFQGFEDKPLK